MQVVKRTGKNVLSVSAKEISGTQLKSLSSDLAQKVLKILSKQENYPKEVAKQLKMHEQKVYYHIRNLEKAGIIKVIREETRQGATAKYYALCDSAFVMRYQDFQDAKKIAEDTIDLQPFVSNGELHSTIVIGSPFSHGPERSQSRDGYYGVDLALFLGTFLTHLPDSKVRMDTEMKAEDLKENLILLGGPAVNKILERVNSKLPIRFVKDKKWYIYSRYSKKKYTADECGMIVEAENPFAKGKRLLIIAGIRYSGTKAAVLALIKGFDKFVKGNKYNKKAKASVVEGFDADSDGILDTVEFSE